MKKNKQIKYNEKKLLKKSPEKLVEIILNLVAELKLKNDEYDKLLKKYEDKLNQYQLNIYNEYVTKSEKLENDDVVVNEVEVTLEKDTSKKTKRNRKPMIEQFVNDLKNMVTRTEIVDYDFEENNVDKTKVKPFGEDTSIKIETKTSFEIVEIKRPKYKDKDKIYQAISNDIFPHSVLTPSFVANIINFKYRLSIPLYRYSEMLKSANINISESDLCNYVKRATNLLIPIYDEIKEELVMEDIIHIDETTLEVIDVKEKAKCYMFVYRSNNWSDRQISYYEFNTSRSTDKVGQMLKDYEGYVVCDGYSGYDFLEEQGIEIQRCWVHIRRYFMDCMKIVKSIDKYKHPAYKVIKEINKLFEEEAKFKENKYTSEKIKEERQNDKYQQILKNIDTNIEELAGIPILNDNLIKAINYYHNIKTKGQLYTFLEDGRIEIDNNIAERTVKPFVIGRKNFLFSKTTNGADISAICYTIVQTALNHHIEPEKYIKFVLENISKKDIEELMPWSELVKKECQINLKELKNPVAPEINTR